MELREVLVQNPIPRLFKAKKRQTSQRRTVNRSRPAPARMISVIIPAHNEEKYLRQTLEALEKQNYGWFEVVVVANGCTDNTAEVRGKRKILGAGPRPEPIRKPGLAVAG